MTTGIWTSISRRKFLSTAAAMSVAGAARAQQPAEVKVGLIVPLSGLFARPGQVMRMGAEIGIDEVNASGGIKSLGGAKLKLVVLDCGDTIEKAKNAAQRMVAQEPDLVAASGAYASSFTLAVTEVTERAELPMLTLSYSDLITERGFKYIFQTSALASTQAAIGLPEFLNLIEKTTGKRPKTAAMVMDNTAVAVATAKALKDTLLAKLGLELTLELTWTPPLSDATPIVSKIRTTKPDILLFNPTAISDAKLILETMTQFGLGQGKIPTVGFSIPIIEPDMLQSVSPEVVQGLTAIVGNWSAKGEEAIAAELKKRYNEPWMTQNAISTYGDIMILRDALEKSGKADRHAVADALRTMDGGPAKYFPGGLIKFDEKGRRVGATITIVQWQNGVPVSVYPPDLAVGQAVLAKP
jgi:branched-chain amino acid transport system substrate-binding protein